MMTPISLLALSYAGGTAQIYKRWSSSLHPSITLVPLELAGRGSRFGEPYYESVDEAVKNLLQIVRSCTQGRYALFGHSMGSLLAYELMQSLRAEGLPLPMAAFLSGRGAPHCRKEERMVHNLPDEEFLSEVKSLGGTSTALFHQKELLNLFLPILRADFKLVDLYRPREEAPLPVDLIVMNGKNDTSLCGKPEAWQTYTTGTCTCVYFEGGHFYLHDNEQEVVNLINDTLRIPVRRR